MSFNVQGAKGLTIPEGAVKTIHDKDNRLLWGAVGYNTKYAGDTFQQTYSGKNLLSPLNPQDSSITVGEDGKISYSVTAATTYYNLTKSTDSLVIPAGNYTFSISQAQTGQIALRFLDSNGATINTFTIAAGGTSISFTLSQPSSRGYLYLRQTTAGTAYSGSFYPQLEAGSTPTAYEPYVGGIPSPNPDYPQDIQVVTGEQTVKVMGKNLFDKTGSTILNTAVDGNGIGSNSPSAYRSVYIPCKPNTYYTVSKTLDSTKNRLSVAYTTTIPTYGLSDVYGLINDNTKSSLTIQTGNDAKYLIAYVWISGGTTTANDMIDSVQIELGSATTFEPYQGQTYEVNLGKNLLNLEALATTGIVVSNGVATGTVRSFNAAYGTSSGVPVTFNAKRVAVSLKAYTDAETAGTNNGLKLRAIYKDGTGADIIAFTNDITTATYKTAVTSGTREIDKIAITYGNLPDNTWHITDFQIEAGSTATSYAPYFTPIELAKVDNSQDYIWKDGDTWKVHKATGKASVALSDSVYTLTGGLKGAIYQPTNRETANGNALCSKAKSSSGTGTLWDGCFYENPSNCMFVGSTTDNLASLKAKFDGADLYYTLATPTDTAITDETLIGQLEAIDEWCRRAGYEQTVISVAPNLPLIVSRELI